jgi:hypothetical protein
MCRRPSSAPLCSHDPPRLHFEPPEFLLVQILIQLFSVMAASKINANPCESDYWTEISLSFSFLCSFLYLSIPFSLSHLVPLLRLPHHLHFPHHLYLPPYHRERKKIKYVGYRYLCRSLRFRDRN